MDVEVARILTEGLKAIGAGCAVVALAGVGAGIGLVFASLISSTARNPVMQQKLFPITMIGFALTEAIGLFALVIAFLILYG